MHKCDVHTMVMHMLITCKYCVTGIYMSRDVNFSFIKIKGQTEVYTLKTEV